MLGCLSESGFSGLGSKVCCFDQARRLTSVATDSVQESQTAMYLATDTARPYVPAGDALRVHTVDKTVEQSHSDCSHP